MFKKIGNWIKNTWQHGFTPTTGKILVIVASSLLVIALIFGVIGAFRYSRRAGNALEAQVTNLDAASTTHGNDIATLQAQASDLQTQVTNLGATDTASNDAIAALQAQNTALQQQVAALDSGKANAADLATLQAQVTELQNQVALLQNPPAPTAPAPVSGSAGPCWTDSELGQVWMSPAGTVHIEGICPGATTSAAAFGVTNAEPLAVFMTTDPTGCVWAGIEGQGHLEGCSGAVVMLQFTPTGEAGVYNVSNPTFGRSIMTYGQIADLFGDQVMRRGDTAVVFVAWKTTTSGFSGLWVP